MVEKEITIKVQFHKSKAISIGHVKYGRHTDIARFFNDILQYQGLKDIEDIEEIDIFNAFFINKVVTENTGGGCMVDFVHLKEGRVLGINDEIVVLYPSFEAFCNGDYEDSWQTIDLLV